MYNMALIDHKFDLESKGLRVSVYGNLLMIILGISFAVTTGSHAILLDGIYSVIAFVMALFAQRIAILVDRPPSDRFPFGYAHFEPIFNTLRSLLIIVISIFAFWSAIEDVIAGGHMIDTRQAFLYGVICTLICLGISFYERKLCRRIVSPLLVVDSRSWMIDGLLSVTATVAFLSAMILQNTGWQEGVLYIDPFLVILLVLIMIPIPIKMLKGSVREVLQANSADGVEQTLRENVERVVEPLNLQTVDIRMLKTGRYFYVMIYLVLKTEASGMTVFELDQIREKIISALPPCGERLIIDVVFTTQDKWLLEQQSLSQTDFTVSS